MTPEFCRRTIEELEPVQRELRARLGTTFAFLGDEIYLRAGRSVPGRKHYGDYPQIEDGIGMVRAFNNEFDALLRRLERRAEKKRLPKLHGTVMTGTLFAPILKRSIERLNRRFGSKLHVVGVENNYFGGDVSVAGLLTGGDFLSARERVRGQFVIIPASSVKSGESIMLDGTMLSELQEEFRLRVHALDLKGFGEMLYG